MAAGLGGLGAMAMSGHGPARAETLVPANLKFTILRGGDAIGTHTLTHARQGDDVITRAAIEMKVTLLTVPVFRFAHESQEIWRDGKLIRLTGRTDDDGRKIEIEGSATSDGFRISSGKGPELAPADAMTTNRLWTAVIMRQKSLVDAQYGGFVELSARAEGEDRLAQGGNGGRATRYRLVTPNIAGQVWYDADGNWVKGTFQVRGETLEYVPA